MYNKPFLFDYCCIFQIFRETKESEIQSLLRARRDLESKVAKLSHGVFDDVESVSRVAMETTIGERLFMKDHIFHLI